MAQDSSARALPPAVHLSPRDNVAIAARTIPKGASIALNGHAVILREPVRLGHKLSLTAISRGEPIRKYGQIIGFASDDIAPGSWVHVHNCSPDRFERDYAFSSEVPSRPRAAEARFFEGYRRPH